MVLEQLLITAVLTQSAWVSLFINERFGFTVRLSQEVTLCLISSTLALLGANVRWMSMFSSRTAPVFEVTAGKKKNKTFPNSTLFKISRCNNSVIMLR